MTQQQTAHVALRGKNKPVVGMKLLADSPIHSEGKETAYKVRYRLSHWRTYCFILDTETIVVLQFDGQQVSWFRVRTPQTLEFEIYGFIDTDNDNFLRHIVPPGYDLPQLYYNAANL